MRFAVIALVVSLGVSAVHSAAHSTKTTSTSQLVKKILEKLHAKGHESGKRAEELSFDTSDESSGAYKKSLESESSGYGMRMTAVRGATHATKTTSKKSQLVKRLLGKLFGKRAEELSFDTSDESSGAYKKSIESESSGYGMRMTAVRNAGHSTKAANKKSQHVKRLLGKLHGKGHESGKRADDTSDESSGAYKKSFESESSGYGMTLRSATHSTKTANKKSQLVRRLLEKLFEKRAEELSFDTSDESSGAYKKSFESESSGYGELRRKLKSLLNNNKNKHH